MTHRETQQTQPLPLGNAQYFESKARLKGVQLMQVVVTRWWAPLSVEAPTDDSPILPKGTSALVNI